MDPYLRIGMPGDAQAGVLLSLMRDETGFAEGSRQIVARQDAPGLLPARFLFAYEVDDDFDLDDDEFEDDYDEGDLDDLEEIDTIDDLADVDEEVDFEDFDDDAF